LLIILLFTEIVVCFSLMFVISGSSTYTENQGSQHESLRADISREVSVTICHININTVRTLIVSEH